MSGDFQKIVASFCIRTTGAAEAIPKRFTLRLLSKILFATPTKTGRLKGNNQIGINFQPNSVLEAFDTSKEGEGSPTYARESAKLKDFKIGDTIFITNNVDYGYMVEFGHPEPRTPRAMFTSSVNDMIAEWDAFVVRETAP